MYARVVGLALGARAGEELPPERHHPSSSAPTPPSLITQKATTYSCGRCRCPTPRLRWVVGARLLPSRARRAPRLCRSHPAAPLNSSSAPCCLQAQYQAWGYPFDYIKPAQFPDQMAKLYDGPAADIPGTGPAPLLMRATDWMKARAAACVYTWV